MLCACGRPVAYLPELDELPVDYNGFMEDGLVPRVDGWNSGLYAILKSFYSAPGWADIMRTHDASYGACRETLENEARQRLVSYLSGKSFTGRATSVATPEPLANPSGQGRDGYSEYSLG